MKVTIIETLDPEGCVTDADTGLADTLNRQAREPVRMLTYVWPKPVGERDLEYLHRVLAYSLPSKIKYLASLFGVADKEAAAMIERGTEHIVSCYVEKLSAVRKAESERKQAERAASLGLWCFRNKIVRVSGWAVADREEIVARVKHKVLSEEASLETDLDARSKRSNTSRSLVEHLAKPYRRMCGYLFGSAMVVDA
jgi:hypothetical protein